MAALLSLSLFTMSYPNGGDSSPASSQIDQDIIEKLRSIDGFFTENAGQVPNEQVRFYSSGGVQAGFAESAVFIKLVERNHVNPLHDFEDEMRGPQIQRDDTPSSRGVMVRITFDGANRVTPQGVQEMSHLSNYFIGNDPSKWRTGVRSYREIVYSDLYDGVDLSYRTQDGQLKYEFILDPGTNPALITVSYEGVESPHIDQSGELVVSTALGEMTDGKPISFQDERPVECAFVQRGPLSFGFRCEGRDSSRPLVIDPLVYATFLGGGDWDAGHGIAVDSSGNAYVTGDTASTDFPTTPGSFDTTSNDAFVVKLNAAGNALVYATFLGGGSNDYNLDIAIDSTSNAYVIGETGSTDFPVAQGSFDTTFNGSSDAFVVKLNAAGTALVYSTFLGGGSGDTGWGIAVDSSGSAYVTGWTHSPDFPVTPGSFDTTHNGGANEADGFVAKLNLGGGANTPPEILSFAVGPSPSFEGGAVLFAVDATDADGDALTYHFDFESDGVFDISGPGSTAMHAYGDDFDGTATVRVSDGNLSTEETTRIIVLNVPPTTDGEITATATSDITLRVAGEKWHDVSAYVVDDGNETLMASLVREPGKPQETSFEISIDATKSSSLRIAYTPDDDKVNGQPNGANPAWLTFTFDSGPPVEIHHTFNVRHPDTWNWTVSLNSLLAGRDITFTATATNPGSDDLTFTWDWGDGTPATAKTYYNDGIGPDPYPSPGGTFPFTATDSEAHAYPTAGMYELKLIVRDDDGGTTEIPLVVVIV